MRVWKIADKEQTRRVRCRYDVSRGSFQKQYPHEGVRAVSKHPARSALLESNSELSKCSSIIQNTLYEACSSPENKLGHHLPNAERLSATLQAIRLLEPDMAMIIAPYFCPVHGPAVRCMVANAIPAVTARCQRPRESSSSFCSFSPFPDRSSRRDNQCKPSR